MTTRRALLVSYHFPPSTAAGAQRWDVFTREAVDRGWEFDVVTAAQPVATTASAIRVHHVPESSHWLNSTADALVAIKNRLHMKRNTARGSGSGVARATAIDSQVVRRADIAFPRTVSEWRRNVRALLLYPRFLPWKDAATSKALRLASSHRFDAIITSGPPHVSTDAARVAAAASGAPLFVDFRDPWSVIDVLQAEFGSWSYLKLASYYERRIVNAARLLVMNTERAERAMRERYPHADIVTVPNGFNGERPTGNHADGRFVVLYAGTVYLDRDPRPILAAMARLVPELGLTADNFVFRFYGSELSYGGLSPEELAELAGMPSGLVETHAALPRRQLFDEMRSAALLVNLPQGARMCVPSKVYEYLHFPAWVLGLEHEGSATYDVLSAAGADIATPGDVDTIAKILRTRILDFRAGVRPEPLAKPHEYSAPHSAQRFFDALEQRL